MNVRTFLITGDSFIVKGLPVINPRTIPESITAVDVDTIVGLDTKDGFVKVSMETWRRLELFLSILQKFNFTYLE